VKSENLIDGNVKGENGKLNLNPFLPGTLSVPEVGEGVWCKRKIAGKREQ
jgi:hypothetical protein